MQDPIVDKEDDDEVLEGKILKELRLDVPQATLVADELRSAGVPIPQGILTRKELVDAIMSVVNA